MERIGDLATRVAERLETDRTERIEAWKKKHQTTTQALRERRLSSLAISVPSDVELEVFAGNTTDVELARYEDRLTQCRRCPAHGGACDVDEAQEMTPGIFPRWEESGFRILRCKRYLEHETRVWLRNAKVPLQMLTATFDNFDVDDRALRAARKYVDIFDATMIDGMHFVGNVGAGKTHLASATLRALREKQAIKSALFAYVPKFLDDLRRGQFTEGITTEEAINVDVLVLDDLGAERTTDWVRDQLGIVINERWVNGRPILITSNLRLDEYIETLGDRAHSRLRGMCSLIVPFEASDQR